MQVLLPFLPLSRENSTVAITIFIVCFEAVARGFDDASNKPLIWAHVSRVRLPFHRPFYRYGGHIELIGFKEYYGMPRGHEHDPIYSHQYLRALFGPIFL